MCFLLYHSQEKINEVFFYEFSFKFSKLKCLTKTKSLLFDRKKGKKQSDKTIYQSHLIRETYATHGTPRCLQEER